MHNYVSLLVQRMNTTPTRLIPLCDTTINFILNVKVHYISFKRKYLNLLRVMKKSRVKHKTRIYITDTTYKTNFQLIFTTLSLDK